MKRRSVLKSIGLISGGALIGGGPFLYSCSSEQEVSEGIIRKEMVDLVEEIAEEILPATKDLPGAKEAGVGKYVNHIVSDFYTHPEQQVFIQGLEVFKMDNFASLSLNEKNQYLFKIESESRNLPRGVFTEEDGGIVTTNHPYRMLKQLVLNGYIYSEVVAKKGFKYLPLTEKFVGCMDVTEETRPMYHV